MQYRATPHSTTEMSPAEMLFGRRIKTKLPHVSTQEETLQQKETRQIHDRKKQEQKKAFDKHHHARPKSIAPGDQVLLKQKKTTIKPPYNPEPFTVEEVNGNRLTLSNNGTTRIRDKNKVKLVPRRLASFTTNKVRTTAKEEMDFDIDMRKIRAPAADQVDSGDEQVVAALEVEQPSLQSQEADENGQQELDRTPASTTAEQHQLFTPSDDMNTHLLQLLNAAQSTRAPQDTHDLTGAGASNNSIEHSANEHVVLKTSPQSQVDQPTQFKPTDEMNAHLLNLLGAAQAREASSHGRNESDEGEKNIRITRSRGIALAWNPVMNAGKAVLENRNTIE